MPNPIRAAPAPLPCLPPVLAAAAACSLERPDEARWRWAGAERTRLRGVEASGSRGFVHLRRAHGRLRPCLLAVSVSSAHGAAGTFARGLLKLGTSSRPELEVAALPVPPPLLHCAGSSAFAHTHAVALGSEVFLIGRGATLRVDALTGAARACVPTLFPRKKFAAAAVGWRIYIASGSVRTTAVEEYDPAADTWRVVAEAPWRRYGCAGAAAGSVFYVAGGLAVSGHPVGEGAAPRALEVHACAGSVDALHVASGAWAWSARQRAVPGGGCVVGTCGAGDGHLYVVAGRPRGREGQAAARCGGGQAVRQSCVGGRWRSGRGRRTGGAQQGHGRGAVRRRNLASSSAAGGKGKKRKRVADK
ncbi:F-box/kelch-repeat protein At5g26960-like [Panicum virgatum]|uniref:F-box/kelch-repeat protein At5g26960-like n=1 Tax=Panicum virgatum TaxID=38727 RepID=UPI0019D58280|nr:F-box/kelch-repeat protein At5g26960-like [Panicum virgatum]